jgi:hypothetical protein
LHVNQNGVYEDGIDECLDLEALEEEDAGEYDQSFCDDQSEVLAVGTVGVVPNELLDQEGLEVPELLSP